MTLVQFIFFIFCGLAAINGLFILFFLWFQKEKNLIPNMLLSVFIFIGEIRILKLLILDFGNLIHVNLDTPVIIMLLPILTLIGPILYFYLLSTTQKGFRFRGQDLLHTIPFFLLLVINLVFITDHNIKSFLSLNVVFNIIQKSFFLIHLLIYISFSYSYCRNLIKEFKTAFSTRDLLNPYWLRIIIFTIIILWFIIILYCMEAYLKLNIYASIIETLYYSFIVYTILYFELRFNRITTINNFISKVKSSNISDEAIQSYVSLIRTCMTEKYLYKDHDLTLGRMSKELSIPTHLLSQIINDQFSNNFNDFINSYRINEAKRLLSNPENINFTIASIAYDSGFNTLSAFNSAFKKFSGKTPSQYRIQISKQH